MTATEAKPADSLLRNIETVVTGKQEVIEVAVAALLARGHVLLEDVPGVGKTTIAKAIAHSLQCELGRVQATSDLLPSDLLGISLLDTESQEFRFHKGPVFSNILLVDEINRAPPRTQSALLEAMSERQVTVDRETHRLPDPFFVIATQNPAEQVGTYFLPESQLDRFSVRIEVGYPNEEAEAQILTARESGIDPLAALQPVCSQEEVRTMQKQTSEVRFAEGVQNYLLQIVRATRDRPGVLTGVSPRGSLAFQRMVQGRAFLKGRDFALPDDVKALAVPVLAHRILLASRLRSVRQDQENTVLEILKEIPCP